MIHPVFRLLVSEPQMLSDHLEAYAELVGEEVGAVAQQLKRRMLLHALSLLGVFVAAVLAGVSLLLWGAIPPENMNAPWALFAAPIVPAALGLWAHFAAKAPVEPRGMQAIREQLAADAAMLRSVGAP
jgi:hypothetical protein